jgi:Bacteriophage HK97-gp10, putative tail-component
MSRGKPPTISMSMPNFAALREDFAKLPRSLAAIAQGSGLKEAMQPALRQLKAEVSGGVVKVGPTGNLKRSVKLITKKYKKTGTGVVVVGFQKAGTGKSKSAMGGKVKKGPDRAFHQFWLEFGTSDRFAGRPAATSYTRRSRKEFVKMKAAIGAKQARELISKTQKVAKQGGYIASSFNSRGPFRFGSAKSTRGGRVSTNPKYPRAFFKKSDQPVPLGHMVAAAPVHTAWNKTNAQVRGSMEKEMRDAIGRAYKQMEKHAEERAKKLAEVAAGPATPF